MKYLTDLRYTVKNEDYVYPSKISMVKDDLKIVWKPANQVKLSKKMKRESIWTTANTVEEFLKEQKID